MAEVMRYIRSNGEIKVKAESLKRESGELNGMRTPSFMGGTGQEWRSENQVQRHIDCRKKIFARRVPGFSRRANEISHGTE